MPTRTEETLWGRLFESCGQKKGPEAGEMWKPEPAGLGPERTPEGSPHHGGKAIALRP